MIITEKELEKTIRNDGLTKILTYKEALKKVEKLSSELDEQGFTSILILTARGCRNQTGMRVTHPAHNPEIISNLIKEAAEKISNNPPK